MKLMRKRWIAPVLIIGVVLLAAGCGGSPTPQGSGGRPTATPPVVYGMARVKTSTPAIAPNATATRVAQASPRPSPTPAIAPNATATRVAQASPRPTSLSPTPAAGQDEQADVPRIGVAEARAKAEAGEAVLVDVRGAATYEAQHIAGAISMPASQVSSRYIELPTDKLVIFYCA